MTDIILDYVHVTEYIWKAANTYFGEKSPLRIEWVKEQCLLLLQSRTDKVLGNLSELKDQSKSNSARQKTIKSVINYIVNHQHTDGLQKIP